MPARCLFCGGDASEPDHLAHCDGRQGAVEAEEPPVLDRDRTRRAADRGIAQVEAHTSDEYREVLLYAIHCVARERPTLTSDDVWAMLGDRQMHIENASALGSAFRVAARNGWLLKTDRRVDSIRPATHGRPLRVWESRICLASVAWQGAVGHGSAG